MSDEGFSPTPLFPSDADRRPIYNTAGITSGPSVLGIRYEDGVMIATDTLVTYGSEIAFPDMQRVYKMNENLVLAFSGDYPDFEFIRARVEKKVIGDFCFHQPNHLKPSMLTRWLGKTFYTRRATKKPLSFEAVLGGLELDGTPYLATLDRYGSYIDDFMAATGMAQLGLSVIWGRKPKRREFSELEAAKLIEDIMSTVFLRSCTAVNTYMVGICSRTMCRVVGPFKVNESWSVAEQCIGY